MTEKRILLKIYTNTEIYEDDIFCCLKNIYRIYSPKIRRKDIQTKKNKKKAKKKFVFEKNAR